MDSHCSSNWPLLYWNTDTVFFLKPLEWIQIRLQVDANSFWKSTWLGSSVINQNRKYNAEIFKLSFWINICFQLCSFRMDSSYMRDIYFKNVMKRFKRIYEHEHTRKNKKHHQTDKHSDIILVLLSLCALYRVHTLIEHPAIIKWLIAITESRTTAAILSQTNPHTTNIKVI